MIRAFRKTDTARLMQIWLAGNEEAHSFVDPAYWRANFPLVQEQLSQAEVFVCEAGGEIQGFLGLVGSYIAGFFVDGRFRSSGIGAQLLASAKQTHPALSLNVYQKNIRAVAFYLREGFSVQSEALDGATGEREYTMVWRR